jgi:predicted RNA-binding protein with RPS1 domain
MIYARTALFCLGVLQAADALQLPACAASRVSASRVLATPAYSRAMVSLCDAAEPAAAEEPADAVAEAAEAAPAPAARTKGNKTPLEELEAGAELEGKIRSVMAYGAFVDVGAATDGLLHVSEICNEFVKDANDKLTAGDAITVKVKSVNLEKQQLALTCKDSQERAPRERKPRPDLSEFEGADPKAFIEGKVNSITDFGAFVTIKEGVDGLVHISQIQDGGVGKVSDVLSVGQEVKVRITQVEASKRRIALSMREWSEESEQRPRRGGGGGGGMGSLGDADKEFHLNEEELAALTVGDELDSPFVAAFSRAELVQESKAAKKRYAKQVL